MKKTLIVRPVDDHGRVVLPKHLLKDVYKVKSGEKLTLEVLYTEDSIVLKKYGAKNRV